MNNFVKIYVTGDFCIRSSSEELVINGKSDTLFQTILSQFINNDLNIVDLECPLTTCVEGILKTGPLLKANPDSIKALTYLQVHLAAMSNNHIMDYNAEGLNDTIQTCRNANVDVVGVGNSLTEARKPFYTEIKGIKIAVLNFSENEFASTYGEYPGANPLNLIDNYRDILNAKKQADFVLLLFHGGNEFYELPSPRIKQTCRFFVDAGVDAVVMHHTHAFSGYEVYSNKPIFYGLGNFNFDWDDRVNQQWNYGYTVRFILSDNKIDFVVLPHVQSNGNPGTFPLQDDNKVLFFNNISELNRIIQNDAELESRFVSFCKQKQRLYEMYLQPYSGKIMAPLFHKGILPDLLSNKKRKLILNLMRCESHRDILFHLLNN